MAEYIRESALQSEVVQSHSESDMKEYRALVGMANNLNQLTRLSHQEGIYYTSLQLDRLLAEISDIVRTYKQTNKKKK